MQRMSKILSHVHEQDSLYLAVRIKLRGVGGGDYRDGVMDGNVAICR